MTIISNSKMLKYNSNMFSLYIPKLIRLPVVLLTMWILLFGFVCAGMFHEPSMRMDTMTSNPTLTAIAGEESCCGTNVSQHIQFWRDTFLAVPQGVRDALTLLALGLTLILGYSWVSLWNRRPSIELDIGQLRLYIRQNPELILFNHLKLAFARGILNPKIY